MSTADRDVILWEQRLQKEIDMQASAATVILTELPVPSSPNVQATPGRGQLISQMGVSTCAGARLVAIDMCLKF